MSEAGAGEETSYRVAVSADEDGPSAVFEHLWTPYRMAYIRGEGKPTGAPRLPVLRHPDPERRGRPDRRPGATVYAVLNLYPYNAGHLMVVPYRHVPDYTDLTADEVAELGAFTQTAMRVVRAVSGAHGFNIGMNQGAVAGAGIADHLHQHVSRAGAATPTSCRSSASPACCPRSCARPATCSRQAWPRQAPVGPDGVG